MNSHICMKAPAKINIHLDIHDKRSDGFHELTSIFQKVNLFDTIDMTIHPSREFLCKIDDGSEIPVKSNTMYQACRRFCIATHINLDIDIRCDKQIPVTAGLGGGSSDAASVLMGLQSLTGHPLAVESLFEIGAEVGSDVPFFLGGPASLVTGRGECLKELSPREDLKGVIVLPAFGVSTPIAFSLLDELRANGQGAERSLNGSELERMYQSPVRSWKFFNSFTPVLNERHPQYREMERILDESGFDSILISGSGSSLVALTDDAILSEKLFKDIRSIPNVKVIPIKVLAD